MAKEKVKEAAEAVSEKPAAVETAVKPETKTETPQAPAAVKAKPAVKDVPLGIGTINDHEKRIASLEARIAEILAAVKTGSAN